MLCAIRLMGGTNQRVPQRAEQWVGCKHACTGVRNRISWCSKLVQLNMRCASLLSTLLVIASNGCCLTSAHGDHSFGCVFCKDALTELGTRAHRYQLRPNLQRDIRCSESATASNTCCASLPCSCVLYIYLFLHSRLARTLFREEPPWKTSVGYTATWMKLGERLWYSLDWPKPGRSN